jgi:alpha-L-fucosidase
LISLNKHKFIRWGTDASCQHGDVNTCTDRFSPKQLQGKKYENAMTLDLNCWGYRHNFELNDVISIEQLLNELIITISFGGNMLINVGPTSKGIIPAIFEERLRQMGEWLNLNGEGIYDTQPWLIQNDTFNDNQIWYTSRISNLDYQQSLIELYAMTFKWPHLLKSFDNIEHTIKLNVSLICQKISYVSFLGYSNNNNNNIKNELDFKCITSDPYVLLIDVKDLNPIYSISKYVWTFKVYLLF